MQISVDAQDKKTKEADRREKLNKQIERQNLIMRLVNIQYNPALKEELDIVDDQIADLRKIGNDYNKDLSEFNGENYKKMVAAQELRRKGEHQKASKLSMEYQEAIFDISDEHFKKVEKKLLPHQIKRLMQITKQESLKYRSKFKDEFGIVLAVADDVGLTSSEKRKLEEATAKAREKYYAEIVKLKEKAHAEIRKAIPAAKREKVDDIVGDIFDHVQTKRKSREATKKPRK